MNETIKLLLICLAALIASLAVVILVFVSVIHIKSAAARRKVEGYGRPSEKKIDSLLKKAFGENAVLCGIYLPYIKLNYDKQAEIDHIVILRSGIYVIEVKSHNGRIINPNEHDWLQIYNDKKLKFYNPLRQNNTHVRIINDILKSEGQYNVPLYNIVVFTSNKVGFTNSYENLIKTDQLVTYIRRHGKKNALSTAQTARIRAIIKRHAIRDPRVMRRHKNEMRKYKL